MDGVPWTFTVRAGARRDERGSVLVLILRSPFETRIGTCPIELWEDGEPDLAELHAASVPVGASRGRELENHGEHGARPGEDEDGNGGGSQPLPTDPD